MNHPSSNSEPPRLRRPDRRQVLLEPMCWGERLPAEHAARTVWQVVERRLHKVRCVTLWVALAYNVIHFARELLE